MLYIIYVNLFSIGYIGIKKKVFAQIRVFGKEFGKVYYTTYSGQMLYLMLEDTVVEKELALTKQECHNLILKWINKYNINRTYIRYDYADKWFLQFLKEQKKKNLISILEFPTIPYDGELSNKRLIAEDKYYRDEMAVYMNQCTTYSNFDEVFDIPCIPLMNGVNIEEQPMKSHRTKDGNIVLLAVATMGKWHGYERVIEGMADYYKCNGKRNIIFKLVGDGPELNMYKKLVQNYGLESHVKFFGKLEKEELDKQYSESSIAIGSLGFYKTGIEQGAPIKIREYCCRGIPFIYGYKDLGFKGNEDYILCVPNNDDKIDMQDVIEFYEKTADNNLLISKMHKDAIERFTWERILKPVVDYFQG